MLNQSDMPYTMYRVHVQETEKNATKIAKVERRHARGARSVWGILQSNEISLD